MPLLHEDRLFPADPCTRELARSVYASVRSLLILSTHGHTQATWFAENNPFPNPAKLLVQPDHYIYRMLYSQGITLEELEIGAPEIKDPHSVWRIFAGHYHLFRGTPTRMWLDFVFQELFGLNERLSARTADVYFDTISEKLNTPELLPRALYERFNIEVLATTDSPIDSLDAHRLIRDSEWKARIIPTFRPDPVVDPDFTGFRENIEKLGQQTREDTSKWKGYLRALERARAIQGARMYRDGPRTSHRTHCQPLAERCVRSLQRILAGRRIDAQQHELFRAQMLTEMARMSIEDGLVMQIHPGSRRNHNRQLYKRYGRDVGADIPTPTNYVDGLRASAR